MKNIISINGFEPVFNEELYNELFDEEDYHSACESGCFSQESYLDSIAERATEYRPCTIESGINYFDCATVTEYSITVYWMDGGNLRPAYRLKFEGAILADADTPIGPEHTGLIRCALELVEEANLPPEPAPKEWEPLLAQIPKEGV